LAVRTFGLWGGALSWMVLNVLQFVVLAIVTRGQPGIPPAAHIRHGLLPASLSLIPLLAARVIADWTNASALLGCGLAAIACALAALAFVALRRPHAFARPTRN
jgi:hypothetical protein